jgi:hypothetical protein
LKEMKYTSVYWLIFNESLVFSEDFFKLFFLLKSDYYSNRFPTK